MSGSPPVARIDADWVSTVRLAFVGDICLAGGLQDGLRERGPDFPFAGAHEAYGSADLVVGNLECCIVDGANEGDVPANVLVVPEYLASGLGRSGINIVSLANNHILDGAVEGLVSTQRFLAREGIQYFGAGLNCDEAEKALIVESKGLRIALLGACDVPRVYATKSRPGAAPLEAKRLRQRIAEIRSHADVVVLSLHADLEFTSYPSPSRQRLSRWLVEQGADLVIQHHPHVCQGVEIYHDGLIAYSLGNFVFPVQGNRYFEHRSGTDWGLVLRAQVRVRSLHRSISHDLFPIRIDSQNATKPSAGSLREEQLALLADLSQGLSHRAIVRKQRLARCLKEAESTMYSLYYLGRRKGLLTMMREILAIVMSPYERRWIYGLVSLGMFG